VGADLLGTHPRQVPAKTDPHVAIAAAACLVLFISFDRSCSRPATAPLASAGLIFLSVLTAPGRCADELLTWASTLPLVAANVLCRRLRSPLTNIEIDSGPLSAVQTGEHSRSLLANEITCRCNAAATRPAGVPPLAVPENCGHQGGSGGTPSGTGSEAITRVPPGISDVQEHFAGAALRLCALFASKYRNNPDNSPSNYHQPSNLSQRIRIDIQKRRAADY
jgi:hypothetical protein